jgi:hypothetical protein
VKPAASIVRLGIMRFLTIVVAMMSSGAFGQTTGPDVADLLRRWVQAQKTNTEKTRQYAYREYIVTVQQEKSKEDRKTETWDVIGLEGSTYRKLIQRNDQPLNPKEQKNEDEHLAKETALRRKETPEQRRNRTLSLTYSLGSLPPERTAQLYDFEFKGKELVNGRDTYLIEGLPKPGVRTANDNEKENLNFRLKMWLDAEDGVEVRGESLAVGEHSRMQKGSIFESRSSRHESGVWLLQEFRVRMNIRFFKLLSVQADMTDTFSNYQKFQVDSRVVEDRP